MTLSQNSKVHSPKCWLIYAILNERQCFCGVSAVTRAKNLKMAVTELSATMLNPLCLFSCTWESHMTQLMTVISLASALLFFWLWGWMVQYQSWPQSSITCGWMSVRTPTLSGEDYWLMIAGSGHTHRSGKTGAAREKSPIAKWRQ